MSDDMEDLVNSIGHPKKDAAPDVAPSPAPQAASPNDDMEDLVSSIGKPKALAPPTPPPTGGWVSAAYKPSAYAQKVAQAESGGNPNAHAKTGTAGGLGQFTDATWLNTVRAHRKDLAGYSDDQVKAMKTDPGLNAQMIDALGDDNTQVLKDKGIPISDATKYGMHWFGPEGFQKLYSAPQNTPVENIIGADTAKNNGLSGMNAKEALNTAANKMHQNYMDSNADLGDTLRDAAGNLLPSAGRAVMGVAHAALHPIDTASTLYQLGKGLNSKFQGMIGEQQDPEQKAKDENLVDALADQYKQDYGSLDGFKRKFANDPAGVVMDAATVLDAGAGTARLAGSATGKVGQAVGRIAPTAGAAIQGVGDRLAGISSAAVAPKVDSMIKKATDGALSGKDLVDPEARRILSQTIQAKGLSEASVREGILRGQGLETPTQVVTGKGAPHEAKDAVRQAIADNNETLDAARTQAFPQPSAKDIAQAVDQAHASSYNAASAKYDALRGIQGSFGPTMPNMTSLMQGIGNRFKAAGVPTLNRQVLAIDHPQAAQAIDTLEKTWGQGTTYMGAQPFDAREILAMKKFLNGRQADATGADAMAMRHVNDAFDQHISNQEALGAFRNAQGQPVTGLAAGLKDANATYRKHFATFETPNGANNTLTSMVKALKNQQGRSPTGALMPSGDPDLYTRVGANIGNDLMHPTRGPATYSQLSAALGPNKGPLDEFVRNSAAHADDAEALNSPVAQRAFANHQDQLSQAKVMQYARDLNNAKATPSIGKSGLRDIFRKTVGHMGTGLLGYHAFGPMGAIAGQLGHSIAEGTRDARIAKKAMTGAPQPSNKLGKLTTAAEVGNLANRSLAANQKKPSFEDLVTSLMNAAKKSKKVEGETTKQLLTQPDDQVVSQLKAAGSSL